MRSFRNEVRGCEEIILASGWFGHVDYGEEFAIGKRDFEIFHGYVAAGAEESYAGEGGAHFVALEAGGFCGAFARFENAGCRFRGVSTPDV